MKIEHLDKKDISVIEPLLLNYPFNDYRRYRSFKKEWRDRCFADRIRRMAAEDAVRTLVAFDRGKAVGIVSLAGLPLDSECFGFKMAKIGCLIAIGDRDSEFRIKDGLISGLSGVCEDEGICHISCRVDTSDFSTIHVLEKNKFYITDTLVTYIFDKKRDRFPALKTLYSIRPCEEKDIETLERLIENSFLDTRYYQDKHLSEEGAHKLYKKWVRNNYADKERCGTLVAESGKRIVGFGTGRKNEELEKLCGIKIFGSALSAVVPSAKGAYLALIQRSIENSVISQWYDIFEFDTQINNYEPVRIWQKLGLSPVRSRHTFHKWRKEA
ncbi:MAG: hypothetical protein WC515_05040 [Candidatus Omnitrophota bacterium]